MKAVRLAVVALGLAVGLCGAVAHVIVGIANVQPSPAPNASSVLAGLSAQDRAALTDFHAAMADIIVRDGKQTEPVCRTVFELRGKYRQALATAFAHTGIVGKYEGLGERLDAYLIRAVGDLDVPLTDELRQAAAQAFASVK